MWMIKRLLVPALGLALSGNAWALFGNDDLSRRLEALEHKVESGLGSDLVRQVEDLRHEVQQLRGEMEVMQHRIQNLQGAASTAPPPVSQPTNNTSRFVTTDRTQLPGRVQSGMPPAIPTENTVERSSPPEDSARLESEYQNAFDLLKAGRYPQAQKAFQAFLDAYPSSSYAGNAQYWLGESYYVQNQYAPALGEFGRVIQNHPKSAKVPDAMLKVGYIQYDRKAYDKSRKILEDLVSQYPQSTPAILARKQLDRMSKSGH